MFRHFFVFQDYLVFSISEKDVFHFKAFSLTRGIKVDRRTYDKVRATIMTLSET
jgi:hypothetical protein